MPPLLTSRGYSHSQAVPSTLVTVNHSVAGSNPALGSPLAVTSEVGISFTPSGRRFDPVTATLDVAMTDVKDYIKIFNFDKEVASE